MGGVCCCFSEDCEDYVNPNSSVYRNCICLRYIVRNALLVYTSIFRRGEYALTPAIQGTASSTSAASLDNALSDMFHSPPRPLPYDADPRYFRLQVDGLVSRREKGSGHSCEDTEPLRADNHMDSGSLTTADKWDSSTGEEGSKEYHSRSSLKLSTSKRATGFTHLFSSADDEDVCPTCLEEYNSENPKIITRCSHHFHLGCIYEWMERSDNCPVCGKLLHELHPDTEGNQEDAVLPISTDYSRGSCARGGDGFQRDTLMPRVNLPSAKGSCGEWSDCQRSIMMHRLYKTTHPL